MSFQALARQSDGVVVLDLSGEVNRDAEQALDEAYRKATDEATAALVLNFGDVEYINSTGIALIVGVLAQARKAGIQVRAFGLSPHYQEIFEITKLADFVGIFPDEATAVGA
jgi:anti-anti-sigma factor